jgi:DNA-binding transcriptional regulator YdaS (Cro superfamily)
MMSRLDQEGEIVWRGEGSLSDLPINYPDTFATPIDALRAAVQRATSQAKLALICGVKQPSVWRWLDREAALPADHVLDVERELRISRHDLNRKIYPLEQAAPRVGSLDDLAPAR